MGLPVPSRVMAIVVSFLPTPSNSVDSRTQAACHSLLVRGFLTQQFVCVRGDRVRLPNV